MPARAQTNNQGVLDKLQSVSDKLQSVGLPIGGGSHAIFGPKTGGKGVGTQEAAATGNVLNGELRLLVHQADGIV